MTRSPRVRRPTERAAAAAAAAAVGSPSKAGSKSKKSKDKAYLPQAFWLQQNPLTITVAKQQAAQTRKKTKSKNKKKGSADEPMDVDSASDVLEVVGDEESSSSSEEEDEVVDDGNLPEMDAHAEIPPMKLPKNESSRDLHTIFSGLLRVKFVLKDDDDNVIGVQSLKGRWCLVCRASPKYAGAACRGAFKLGGNSSCRQHIRSHYEEYLKLCKEAGIKPKDHCMPRDLWKKKQLQEAIASGKTKIAQGYDGHFPQKIEFAHTLPFFTTRNSFF
ncbi:hypothetical protein SISNIDRAFT_470817 [Sistotremastrum niveocremeum HHB9708]|uniref:Uncharacterized protein n=1 Tax=Sistotremastrum niveocremeum HHB9708 TaxID=1314777 RepID=A0A164NBN1_9AGAM|nr:hypothetical protein SISNIDRAFT_470817 [Sistotremastrum niveocremeum HHB9708]